jgi:hypothetical protein
VWKCVVCLAAPWAIYSMECHVRQREASRDLPPVALPARSYTGWEPDWCVRCGTWQQTSRSLPARSCPPFSRICAYRSACKVAMRLAFLDVFPRIGCRFLTCKALHLQSEAFSDAARPPTSLALAPFTLDGESFLAPSRRGGGGRDAR